MKKVLNMLLTVFLVIVLIAVTVISVVMIVSSKNDGVANIFGYSPIVIYDTKSMEPTFSSSDLVIVEIIDEDTVLKENDIISFWGFVDGYKSIITHRIVEVNAMANGDVCYTTKGDNNALSDQDPLNENMQNDVFRNDIIGVYATQIPGLGSFMNFIKTPTGILVCFVIPIALIFLWQLYRVIRLAMALHREESAKKNAEMSEEEKKRVIEEYLRQQQSQAEVATETPVSSDDSSAE